MKEYDYHYYQHLLPAEDPLFEVLEVIPWDSFVLLIEQYYSTGMGQPTYSPLLMLKLEFLRYFRRLPDREVIARSRTDVVFRYFLQIPVRFQLLAPTSHASTR